MALKSITTENKQQTNQPQTDEQSASTMPHTQRNPDRLRLEHMASGRLSLILREGVEWGGFEEFANALLSRIGGEVVSRADSPVERVWTVRVRGETFWLAFDDWHGHYELSAQSVGGDAVLTALAAEPGAVQS